MNNIENMKQKETIKKDLLYARNRKKEWTRFNYNQCYSTEYIFNEETQNFYKLVRSYNTIVEIWYSAYFIELGKWSKTTSKHVSQFYNQNVDGTGSKRLLIDLKDFCDRL